MIRADAKHPPAPPRSRPMPMSPAVVQPGAAGVSPAGLRFRLAGLFFIHSFAPALWMVSLGNVLKEMGLAAVVPWAYALGPLSALVSPLLVGALADQRIEAQQLLRWLCWASAVFLALAFGALERGWGVGWFLAMHALHSLVFTPTWALVVTIQFAHLRDPGREFPLSRVWATISWILAGLAVSFWLQADTSPRGGLAAAGVLCLSACYTWFLPRTPAPSRTLAAAGWRGLLGLDALRVFRGGDYRVFLVTTAGLAIPVAAFFPYAPQQLRFMGSAEPTALMSIGQMAETLSMLGLGWVLARARIKWVMAAGLGFAVLRYLCLAAGAATGRMEWMWPGLAMHGLIFTFYYVTAQIFLELRVDPGIRARAQALLTTFSSGLGALAGILGTGWWHGFVWARPWPEAARWAVFWLGLAGFALLVLLYFLRAYVGRGGGAVREAAA
jgi:hypothetical protein